MKKDILISNPTKPKSVLIFTGHLLDAAGRKEQRFPHKLLGQARRNIHQALDALTLHHTPDLAISSLGAGGDMIFAEEALKRKIPLIVFLPFKKDKFLERSVTYLKGIPDEDPEEWEIQFNHIIQQATDVVVIRTRNITLQNAFAACNKSMLKFALKQAHHLPHQVQALALVKDDEKKIKGGSSDFLGILQSKSITIHKVWPLDRESPLEILDNLHKAIPIFERFEGDADRYQSRWKKRLKVSLAILATVAFFDAFVTAPDHLFFGHGQLIRMVSLVTSMVGAVITLQLQLSDKTTLGQWTQNRAKAEQIRSEIWFYLFDLLTENNKSGTYTEDELETYIKKISPKKSHLPALNREETLLLKKQILTMDLQEKIDTYLGYRLESQLHYFNQKATLFKKKLHKYKIATITFLMVSMGWGSMKMLAEFFPLPSIFMDVSPLGMMISFIALVSTYSEAQDSKELEYKYHAMAHELRAIKARFEKTSSENTFFDTVRQCETLLRTQNNEWSIKREEQA